MVDARGCVECVCVFFHVCVGVCGRVVAVLFACVCVSVEMMDVVLV